MSGNGLVVVAPGDLPPTIQTPFGPRPVGTPAPTFGVGGPPPEPTSSDPRYVEAQSVLSHLGDPHLGKDASPPPWAYHAINLPELEAYGKALEAIIEQFPTAKEEAAAARADEQLVKSMRMLFPPSDVNDAYAKWRTAHGETRQAEIAYQIAVKEALAAKEEYDTTIHKKTPEKERKAAHEKVLATAQAAEEARLNWVKKIIDQQRASPDGIVNCSPDFAEYCVKKLHDDCKKRKDCSEEECECVLLTPSGELWDPELQEKLRKEKKDAEAKAAKEAKAKAAEKAKKGEQGEGGKAMVGAVGGGGAAAPQGGYAAPGDVKGPPGPPGKAPEGTQPSTSPAPRPKPPPPGTPVSPEGGSASGPSVGEHPAAPEDAGVAETSDGKSSAPCRTAGILVPDSEFVQSLLDDDAERDGRTVQVADRPDFEFVRSQLKTFGYPHRTGNADTMTAGEGELLMRAPECYWPQGLDVPLPKGGAAQETGSSAGGGGAVEEGPSPVAGVPRDEHRRRFLVCGTKDLEALERALRDSRLALAEPGKEAVVETKFEWRSLLKKLQKAGVQILLQQPAGVVGPCKWVTGPSGSASRDYFGPQDAFSLDDYSKGDLELFEDPFFPRYLPSNSPLRDRVSVLGLRRSLRELRETTNDMRAAVEDLCAWIEELEPPPPQSPAKKVAVAFLKGLIKTPFASVPVPDFGSGVDQRLRPLLARFRQWYCGENARVNRILDDAGMMLASAAASSEFQEHIRKELDVLLFALGEILDASVYALTALSTLRDDSSLSDGEPWRPANYYELDDKALQLAEVVLDRMELVFDDRVLSEQQMPNATAYLGSKYYRARNPRAARGTPKQIAEAIIREWERTDKYDTIVLLVGLALTVVEAAQLLKGGWRWLRKLARRKGSWRKILKKLKRKRSPLSDRGTVRTGPGKGAKRQTGAPDGTERWSSQLGRTSAENAREHAVGKRGHAKEFGLTEREYVDAANDFVSNPPKRAEIFVRESGEVMIYDPPTNTFAVRTPEGVPATMFKPDSGSTYWVKELAKHGGRRTGR